jgi:hypothetical protein
MPSWAVDRRICPLQCRIDLVNGLTPVGCQKSIVAVTSRYRPTKGYGPSSLARLRRRRSRVIWSFVYLALRRAFELILLCFRSAEAKEIKLLV